MKQKGVRPEIEVFEPGMVDYVKTLISDGMVTAPYVFNILLGSVGASSADLFSLVNFLSRLPDESEWALAGIGRYQLPMIVQAIVAGGNVRVGMEDSPRQIGIDSWSNAKAVSFATETASLLGRPIATPSEVRERLGVGRA
jgi:3-keto-5-aminohexanoate cleavage enzyme